ncbi:MAG: helix-turn-helix domain-containing protein [Woeseiaceae bacterium]|nr:helix-turn-helix domain-containing protein [Woeseiaceae bacterium]
MPYSLEEIAGTLKTARQNKQLSQRELSDKVGLPQSHISRIENATVDLKLSSLSELARALELELVLVPKKALPAVQSLIRTSGESKNPVLAKSSPEGRTIRRLKRSAEGLLTIQPNLKALQEMLRTADELNRIQLPNDSLERLKKVARQMDKFRKQWESLKPYTLNPEVENSIRRLNSVLTKIRNETVHAIKFPEVTLSARPAYQLPADDEEDNG